MATIEQRLSALEQASNNAPMLVLFVTDKPTPEQAEQIAKAERIGRRLIAFYMPGDTAWMPGYGVPPWEQVAGIDCAVR